MPTHLAKEVPQEVKGLFARASEGHITPVEFCKELDRYEITHVQKLLYIRDAFNLSLDHAKRILIEVEYGSVDTWSKKLSNAIKELSPEDVGLEETK